ncbi:MAG: excinuclease ABC subunit UvrC [Deltaproteobacteria bacterium]|nr:excinuclease ABC subunit UvrC [Deltaproteobacteria bacterium]
MTPGPNNKDPINNNIRKLLDNVSQRPGIYLMKSAENRVLYVGKAANLKKRLRSYFKKSGQTDPKTRALVGNIASFEVIVTVTEKEALILEANLIKRHKPRYNIVLKDDKRYPLLRLNMRHAYPNLHIVRKIKKDGARYFGPYASAGAVRQALKIVNRTFGLRKCKDKEFKLRKRPCLHFQMQTCMAPCCRDVAFSIYQGLVHEVVLFLNGRTPALIRKLKSDMRHEAQKQQFEAAAALRDKIIALERTLEKQAIVSIDQKDRDVIAVAEKEGPFVIMQLFVRGGFIQGSRHFEFGGTMSTRTEVLETFLRQYYEKAHFVPSEILLSSPLENNLSMENMLGRLKGRKVAVRCPQRGEKRRLMRLAQENAETKLTDYLNSATREKDLIARLQQRLRLQHLPERIECFDNSSIYGKSPVSGMVVFEKGRPAKQFYRTYKMRTPKLNDDYAYMAEALKRRFTGRTSQDPFPDLLMVDGGKGQLNIAVAILKGLGLFGAFDIIGIAKKDENRGETADKIYKPGRMNPLSLQRDNELLLFLQNVRDEAHRFAIGFHRRQRGKKLLQSELDIIEGIGKKRKNALLNHFGSIENIRGAGVEAIAAVSGMNRRVAQNVKKALSKQITGPSQV